jgi:integrase/recombinase XerD
MTTAQALTLTTGSNLNQALADVLADKSFGTATKYRERLNAFGAWLATSGATSIDKQTVAAYKRHLATKDKPLSASSINGHLVAVRALLREAADLGLIDERSAERAAAVQGVKEKGERAGNWLSKGEAQALIDAPDLSTTKGIRDRAILGLLVFCGLRRSELAALTIGHLQQREGHRVIADMIGKGGRVRTVKIPVGVGRAIDQWLAASARSLSPDSLVFVAMRKGDHIADGETLSAQALYNLIKEYGKAIGHPELAPHDLRRTFAKLANRGGAALEDISQTLGHASLQTTQRYLGLELNLDNAAPDRVGLKMS